MRDRPNGPELLVLARAAREGGLAPSRAGARSGEAGQLARAMAIAEREIRAGDLPLWAELGRLAALYGESMPTDVEGAALESALAAYNRRLAVDIRAGRFDTATPERARMLQHLVLTAHSKVLETNPDYLEASK